MSWDRRVYFDTFYPKLFYSCNWYIMRYPTTSGLFMQDESSSALARRESDSGPGRCVGAQALVAPQGGGEVRRSGSGKEKQIVSCRLVVGEKISTGNRGLHHIGSQQIMRNLYV